MKIEYPPTIICTYPEQTDGKSSFQAPQTSN